MFILYLKTNFLKSLIKEAVSQISEEILITKNNIMWIALGKKKDASIKTELI